MVQRMMISQAIFFVLVSGCLEGAALAQGRKACKTDVECPGEEICDSGTCALPGGAHATSGGARCKTDMDCPGEQLCKDGACVSPAPAAPTPRAGAPGARCTRDMDCPGSAICSGGKCQAVEPAPAARPKPPAVKTAPRAAPKEPGPRASGKMPGAPAASVEVASRKVRNTYWLVGGISLGVIAVGSMVWGITCSGAGTDASQEHDREKFNSFQTQQKVGYGLAIGLGAVSVTAFVLYLVTGETVTEQRVTAGISADADGFGVSGRWRF